MVLCSAVPVIGEIRRPAEAVAERTLGEEGRSVARATRSVAPPRVAQATGRGDVATCPPALHARYSRGYGAAALFCL